MDVKVRIDGVDHKGQAQLLQGTLWVHVNGRTFTMDAGAGRKSRKKAGAGGSSDTVSAPMPGKVTKILVQTGAELKAGQAVLVMEAMKMEYTLKADIAGTVDSVSCAVGEQVALGKALVKIKPSAE
ncbi:acetyl-CoA carboxylase biotin carboxyl carrier protein subunit [Bdellovibrio sp. SKB1291214]|uniref:acetyl-CoA carboxylase biotin carboxyl carrier protein subunit n=1 Tax=Bdellovibrio sp. SKB1291214 TaxID=1732569 RepID=UPI000B51D7C2|nr:biotin/lipoyl-containing protein [Bdellovibrio sp. SKB1291214]UYL08617.1 acetyl-CoA carboxylase biotin carboxyl carrier protein subunit [Bdellovibrio sp. SKB1291214]